MYKFGDNVKRSDPLYGVIEISVLSAQIIKEPEFVRLGKIHQLGTYRFVKGTANHTRFEHSIGVSYLARQLMLNVCDKEITDVQKMAVEVAALLHDVGHCAFSHVFDDFITRNYGIKLHHENRSGILSRIILTRLGCSSEFCSLVAHLIDTKIHTIPEKFPEKDESMYGAGCCSNIPPYLTSIVSNPVSKFDVDKIDYLIRDAMYMNFGEPHLRYIDTVRIIKRSKVIGGILAFHIDDQLNIYELISRRYIFHSNMYGNYKAVSADLMINDILSDVNKIYQFDQILNMTASDENLTEKVKKFCLITDSILNDILNNREVSPEIRGKAEDLINKNFYEFVGDFKDAFPEEIEKFTSFRWKIQKDVNLPHKIMPKLAFHCNGKRTKSTPQVIHRVYKRE